MRETELAAQVVQHLIDLGWDVYQEVQMGQGEPIADIVALMDNRVHVVECKRSLSFDVIAQASAWRQSAHWVSVAVPLGKYSRGRQCAKTVLMERGIGLFEVCSVDDPVRAEISPALRRWAGHGPHRDRTWHMRDIKRLRGTLSENHRGDCAAGSAGGGHWTQWKATCAASRRYVAANPGCTLKELFAGVDHHYASDVSARSSMSALIQRGEVPGITMKRDGRRYRLFPKEEP